MEKKKTGKAWKCGYAKGIMFFGGFFGTQLFGRAGRGDFLCRAVLLTDARELQRCKDVGLVEFCTAKENCRRKHMLRALGSDEPVQTVNRQICCDVCSQHCSNKGSACSDLDTLDICKRICCKRQRKPPAVRTVSKDRSTSLKQALLEEREKIIATDIGYKMLGNDLVLPMGCIVEICKQARCIQSVEDLKGIPGIRQELLSRIFDVFMRVMAV